MFRVFFSALFSLLLVANCAQTKERRCTISIALAIVFLALLAGSPSAWSASSALSAYVDRVRGSVEQCSAVALERATAARQCANDAQRQIEPLYDAAAFSVRMQRGTSMYLTMHHTKWMQMMQRLSGGESMAADQALVQDIEQLRTLEEKLIR